MNATVGVWRCPVCGGTISPDTIGYGEVTCLKHGQTPAQPAGQPMDLVEVEVVRDETETNEGAGS